MTALMAAILDNHQNIVQLLLDKGADMSCVRVSGNHSLCWLSWHMQKSAVTRKVMVFKKTSYSMCSIAST